MATGHPTGWDPLAAIAPLLAVVMIGLYLGLISAEGDQAVLWFLGGLAVATLLSGYGVVRAAPHRRLALAISGVILVALGFVGLLSIGCPILVAGIFALVAAARAGKGRQPRTR